jgi:hypothetical protein
MYCRDAADFLDTQSANRHNLPKPIKNPALQKEKNPFARLKLHHF